MTSPNPLQLEYYFVGTCVVTQNRFQEFDEMLKVTFIFECFKKKCRIGRSLN